MLIFGLEKLSLIDYPGKLACTIFLFGCNFKCPFCHNPELVIAETSIKQNNLSEEKILSFLKERRKYLDGVCITGGEPLISQELEIINFLKKIKALDYKIKLDTNGANPELLKKLIQANLVDYIAMDIKSDKDNYDLASGTSADIKKIEESIKLIANSNLDYEFRTTLVPTLHDNKIVENISNWLNQVTAGKIKKYILQKFIPRENKIIESRFEKIQPFSDKEMNEFKEIADKFVKTDLRI